MKIDYDVGDVVVCVDTAFRDGGELNRKHLALLKIGSMYRVSAISDRHGVAVEGIRCPFVPGLVGGYHEDRFRKLPKADDEFTEYMRSMKPHKQPVDA